MNDKTFQVLEMVAAGIKQGLFPEDAVVNSLREIMDRHDPIIHVDRTANLIYPDFVKKPLYGDLEKTGPSEISITKTKEWLHENQRANSYAIGHEIHQNLRDSGLIKSCFGFCELFAIQTKGIGFFQGHFSGKAVFGWRGIVSDHNGNGNLCVPYLIEDAGKVVLLRRWLGYGFHANDLALYLSEL